MFDDMIFELKMLQRITNNFSEDHKVGSGGFGDVYWGEYDGKKIAVKRLHQLQGLDDKEFRNEYINLRMVEHENVVKLLGYCHQSLGIFVTQDGKTIFATQMERIFCFEYMEGGNLEKHIHANSCDLPWSTCYKIIKGICEGLNHLHTAYEKPIWHLDIKPANILLDNYMNAKIADLGLSRHVTRSLITTNVKGTQWYMPPEFQSTGYISDKNDVYSLGVLIIKLMDGDNGLTRLKEMREDFIGHVYRKWNERLKEEMPGHQSHEIEILQVKKCVEIALRCVQTNRNKRPSMKVVVDELKQLDVSLPSDDESKATIVQIVSSPNFPDQRHLGYSSGPAADELNVVIVYAFDCSDWTADFYTVDYGVWWMVHAKLAHHYMDSRIGYVYPKMNVNMYTSDMKTVDPNETAATRFSEFAKIEATFTKNMASGLVEAHKLINNRNNGVILLFSDGLKNRGDYFDGAEEYKSKFPVHAFTLGGDEYSQGLHAIARNSPGGEFHPTPVPERPMLSARFSLLLDNIFNGTPLEDENLPSPTSSENQPLDVVLIYAFDCTETTLAWTKMNDRIFWMVHKKLTSSANSCLGYIYPMLTPNNYTSDMKVVDPSDITGYRALAWRRLSCTKNMASGLVEAHKMVRYRGYQNGIILLFSDGLINKGDFFDGAENFRSEFPVHTFTLGGDAYNHGLQAIAKNSPGGIFTSVPVPDRPQLSTHFSELLDSLLVRRRTEFIDASIVPIQK